MAPCLGSATGSCCRHGIQEEQVEWLACSVDHRSSLCRDICWWELAPCHTKKGLLSSCLSCLWVCPDFWRIKSGRQTASACPSMAVSFQVWETQPETGGLLNVIMSLRSSFSAGGPSFPSGAPPSPSIALGEIATSVIQVGGVSSHGGTYEDHCESWLLLKAVCRT